MGASSGIGAGGGGIGSGVSTTGTGQYTPNDPAEKTEPKSEWSSIFVDGEVTDIEHVVLPLKHGLLGKDTRLGTKKLVVRIKHGGRLAIKTINAWNNEETEYQTVRSEGWELDIDVLEAMNEVRPNAESQFDRNDAFVIRDKLRNDIQQRCFSRTGPAGDNDIFASQNAGLQKIVHRF